MESIDRQILELLSHDGRMSYTDLGRETGLSPSAAQQRVRRLESRGIITGYAAQIAPEAVGKMLTAFVAVRPFDPSAPDDIPERVDDIDSIVSCYSVAGDASYLLKVLAESPAQLEALLAEIRAKGNCSTLTTLVLSIPFKDRPVPLSTAPDIPTHSVRG